MTREEAIKIFEDWIEEGFPYDGGYAVEELNVDEKKACNMAIQALSQEPICDRDCEHCTWTECPIEPCDDAISRKAVLDGIEELKKSPWATANRSHGYEYLITEALDVVKDLCVKQLPSVTQKSGKWIPVYQGDEIINHRCSECEFGNTFGKSMYRMNFCPNCGAKMENDAE